MTGRGAFGVRSGCDGDLQHAVALVAEQIVGGFDLVELEAVRYHGSEIDPAGSYHI